MERILVLGIGNTLLSDEGAGIHALDYLRKQLGHIPGVEFVDGGTLSFTLAPAIEEADSLIVIDAAQLAEEPGSVRCFTGSAMDDFLGKARRSVHEVGLKDLIDIARLTDCLPARRALVGIQPRQIDWGERPTEAVERAIPVAAAEVVSLLQRWGIEDPAIPASAPAIPSRARNRTAACESQ